MYRFLDMTFEDPTLLATQHMFGTGLTRYRQLDAAYKGDPVVPWRVVVRAKARALVEMEGASVGREDTRGSDGYGHEGEGTHAEETNAESRALSLHLALRSLDPTGEVLGSTPLASVGKKIVTSETVSATAIRTQVRRAKAARRMAADADDDADENKRKKRKKAARDGDDSDDDVDDDDVERMNEDQLSNFNPLVLMRRAHEADENAHFRTPLEAMIASIRRFKPAAPVTGDVNPDGSGWAHRAALYFGASAAMRRKRRTHDAERVRRAKEIYELLLDGALGGRGDQLAKFVGPRGLRPDRDAYEVPAGGRDDSMVKGDDSRPAELPAHGAAAAIHAISKFVVRSGGGPALVRSRQCLAAALRASGGADRPPQVISRAGGMLQALVQRRRLRGKLLRRLGRICKRLAEENAQPINVSVAEKPDTENLAMRALDLMDRAARACLDDRSDAAEVSVTTAHAWHVAGDRAAVDGASRNDANLTTLPLKLKARAACDAARAADKGSIVIAARGAQALLLDLTPAVRVAASVALGKLGILLVAAEATAACEKIAETVGDEDEDDGCGRVPAMRWTRDADDWETARGPGEDDMEAEEEYRGSFEEEKARSRVNLQTRGGEGDETEGSGFDPDDDERSDDDDDDAAHEVSAVDAMDRLDGGVRLAARVVKSTSSARPFDSTWICTTLSRSAAKDDSQHSKETATMAKDAILESKACAKFACERYRYGGVVGAHVAVYAALNPDQETPKMVDEIHAVKTEHIVRLVKKDVKERRAVMRIDSDTRLPDIDEEANARLALACTDALRDALSVHSLTNTSARHAGAMEGAVAREKQIARQRAALEAQALVLREAGLSLDDPGALELAKSLGIVVPDEFDDKAKPLQGQLPGSTLLSTLDDENAGVPTRVPTRIDPEHMHRNRGPDKETLASIKNMLRHSVAKQHEKHETKSRARVANVWRDARLQRDEKLLRKGETLPKYHPEYQPVSPEHVPKTSDPTHRPVDVYHGLRDPTKQRAAIDDDPMHTTKVAPPGGDVELTRPFGSRPKLLRPSAKDAFRRDPLPGPSTRSIRARDEAREAELKAKDTRRVDTSRRYFGTESFRRPETLTRRDQNQNAGGGSDAGGGGSES